MAEGRSGPAEGNRAGVVLTRSIEPTGKNMRAVQYKMTVRRLAALLEGLRWLSDMSFQWGLGRVNWWPPDSKYDMIMITPFMKKVHYDHVVRRIGFQ